MDPIEALADAIMHEEGWIPPCSLYPRGTRAWRNRNPGNLRPTAADQARDGQNYRVFISLTDGYQALRSDLSDKFTGNNEHGLGPDSRLIDLVDVWSPSSDHNNPNQYCQNISIAMSKSLETQITPLSRLGDIWKGGNPQ